MKRARFAWEASPEPLPFPTFSVAQAFTPGTEEAHSTPFLSTPRSPFRGVPSAVAPVDLDICPTAGARLGGLTVRRWTGATTVRLSLRKPKEEREGRGFPRREAPAHLRASHRALGLLASRALSSRWTPPIIAGWLRTSSIFALQLAIDLEVFADQREAAIEDVCRFHG